MSTSEQLTSKTSFGSIICSDALYRIRRFNKGAQNLTVFAYSLLPVAAAQAAGIQNSNPNTVLFTPTALDPESTRVPDSGSIQDDIDRATGWFFMGAWNERGNLIRQASGPNSTAYCLGNLSVALHQLGTLNGAEYNGAAGALSLLPTAGALVGSPTKELWVVYKLMPLAGILSMFLSLGGTMVPTQAGAYDPKVSFTYGGMIATTSLIAEKRRQEELEDARTSLISPAEMFARRVQRRAEDDRGGIYRNVWIGIAIQAVLIATILIALWFGQMGGVITWWCDVYAWMWFWYFLVVIVSIVENFVGVPFTNNWTLRISKVPHTIQISRDAPKVQARDGKDVLDAIKSGFNATSLVKLSRQEPYTKRNSCFYVVISQEGVSAAHATFRVLSKASNVAVFAFGTALFASATLMSVSVVLMILSLVLSAGVWGRVTAMWIASQMNKVSDPVLHTVVRERLDAAGHMEEILKIPGLIVETGGHIIINGYSIKRRNPWFSTATYIGLLAAPYDITKSAIFTQPDSTMGESRSDALMVKSPRLRQGYEFMDSSGSDNHIV
ncbi:MAG: hypothetical protein L6R35_002802 [Caloplaca aegaea]|nr:MAG: hypothetical protein L6R35_002802 [Caloplaca aegaea]